MKKIDKKPSSIFSNMFTEAKGFNESLSGWNTLVFYYLDTLNAEQLLIIQLLDIEILEDGCELYIKLENPSNLAVITTLNNLHTEKVDYKRKLSLIPLWIIKIFKAV